MIRQYFKQFKHLWASNRVFNSISVLATTFTIAFVMILYMVYSFRTKNIAPESNRSRVLYSGTGYSYFTKDHSQANSGMSYKAAKAIFGNLQNAEAVSYCVAKGEGAAYIGTGSSDSEKRIVSPVDDVYFRIFEFDFISGHPFTAEQSEAARREAIITDKIALKLFNSTDVTGKNILIDFYDYRITGVVKACSSLFNKAYSDIWIIAGKEDMDGPHQYSEGLPGNCQAIVLAKRNVGLPALQKEIEKRIELFNEELQEFTFEQHTVTHAQSIFFGHKASDPSKVFAVLIGIFLIVPAINISGLLSSQMRKRNEEVGIRKAYGAANRQIGEQLLFENLILTFIGGIIGLALSLIVILLFKNMLLSDLMTINAGDAFRLPVSLFFQPVVFIAVFVFCLIINLMSAMIPVWNVSRTSIIDTMKGE
ncbi:MAG TPA: hypothetical protein DDZ78_08670 [Porphyromonadaceae bacterium]|nr:hypothetical protein [Porphyromonadaceae bacterium]